MQSKAIITIIFATNKNKHMKINFSLKQLSLVGAVLLILAVGCKRTQIDVTPSPTPEPGVVVPINDLTQVTASVSGIVLDETNAPIASAVVTSGTATTTTNSNGMFILNNISLSKENGNVTVVKAGYFKGVRSFKTTAGKNHSVRLQLMARALSGTIASAATGGAITSNGGATITFPANAFVTNAGATYTGVVKVYSRWIDPTAANLPFVTPGDLRGVGTNGAENILETYGMVGAELEDASGNALKIAVGKKATISFPIPASLSASAPATIQLWHFDNATARWKEEGTATKAGSTYTAQVDKFSFWNVDVGSTNFINLDYTLINATTNAPLAFTSTRIKRANGSYGYAITNNVGFVSGLVPKSEALVLEVVSGCNTVAYSQNIGPFSANTSLGNINVTLPASQYINFTGTVLNCSAAPVTNGYISLYATGGGGGYAATSTTGAFSFSVLNCAGTNLAYTYQGVDNTTTQQSAVLNGNATSGVVNLGNLNACGAAASADVYVAGYQENASGNRFATLWKNNIPTNLANVGSSANSIFVSGTDVYVAGYSENAVGTSVATVWKNNIPTNLANIRSSANSIFVSGADVYVVGNILNLAGPSNIATLWKNGVATNLTSVGSCIAYSVFVSGIDVYVAGVDKNVGVSNAKIWKNGVATNLTTSGTSNAYSIFVSGLDVYVAGDYQNNNGGTVAGVWKNGIVTNNASGGLLTNSIFVSGTDIYVAGSAINNASQSVVKIWKNGVATNLTTSDFFDASAKSVFVLGTDVYVAGYERSPGNPFIAKVWKNGFPINLSNGAANSQGNSIFVK
jgi:hypothetical protein